jgi:hypothetical protein
MDRFVQCVVFNAKSVIFHQLTAQVAYPVIISMAIPVHSAILTALRAMLARVSAYHVI